MTCYIPLEAKPHVDPSSIISSLRNLTNAVERGELSLSALASFARAAASGNEDRFGVTRQLPLAMLEAIRSNPGVPAASIVYAGVADNLWTWDDAARYEENAAALSARAKRPKAREGVYLTRSRRTKRRMPAVSGMFVPKTSLDLFCRTDICDGAKACLALVIALAGKEGRLVTYTQSLATSLGRTTRTVRNYYVALEEVGLIQRRPGRCPNTVEITVSPLCKPDPYVEPEERKAIRLAVTSENPLLRMMARSVVCASIDAHPGEFATHDRRKGNSAFNLDSILSSVKRGFPAAVPAGVGFAPAPRRGEPVAHTSHSTLLRPTPGRGLAQVIR